MFLLTIIINTSWNFVTTSDPIPSVYCPAVTVFTWLHKRNVSPTFATRDIVVGVQCTIHHKEYFKLPTFLLKFYFKYSCFFNIQLFSSNFTLFLTTYMMFVSWQWDLFPRLICALLYGCFISPRQCIGLMAWMSAKTGNLEELLCMTV